MAGSPRPSFPAPSEPSLRRLGVGGGGGGDRPIRAQLVVALVVGLVLLAVPLYLFRRPSGAANASADASGDAGADAQSGEAGLVRTVIDAGNPSPVKLGAAQRIKCSAGANARGQSGELCDQLDVFEKALAKAITDTADCAPKTGKEGTINFVLTLNFHQRRLTVFPGASGEWRGPQAKRATKCVERALAAPPWEKVKHQYRYYMIAMLATYPAPGEAPGAPLFE